MPPCVFTAIVAKWEYNFNTKVLGRNTPIFEMAGVIVRDCSGIKRVSVVDVRMELAHEGCGYSASKRLQKAITWHWQRVDFCPILTPAAMQRHG